MCYEGQKKLQRTRGNEVLIDSLLRQFMHYTVRGWRWGEAFEHPRRPATRSTPEFVNKYPNMMNDKGFKLLTDGVKVLMEKS